jgi:hypothetical protein
MIGIIEMVIVTQQDIIDPAQLVDIGHGIF